LPGTSFFVSPTFARFVFRTELIAVAALSTHDVRAMLAATGTGLRGLRDRALLLLGALFAENTGGQLGL
jgi:hypothetical protein